MTDDTEDCPLCNGEGWHECDDADGYASATYCSCEVGHAASEAERAFHAPTPTGAGR